MDLSIHSYLHNAFIFVNKHVSKSEIFCLKYKYNSVAFHLQVKYTNRSITTGR
jgi:hypothetical protein